MRKRMAADARMLQQMEAQAKKKRKREILRYQLKAGKLGESAHKDDFSGALSASIPDVRGVVKDSEEWLDSSFTMDHVRDRLRNSWFMRDVKVVPLVAA